MSPSTSRWCPTPEQLMILEELYRRGVRTPNGTQIQKITTHLALYGKIQGKNVFYWFQNHKARDRQKMRKKLAMQLHQQHQLLYRAPASYHQPQQTNSHLYPYNIHYFHAPPPPPPHFHHQLISSTSYSAQSLYPQTTGCCEEAPTSHENRRLDLPKDWTIAGTSLEEGPTSFLCFSKNRPIQTLELFPLKSDREAATSQTV